MYYLPLFYMWCFFVKENFPDHFFARRAIHWRERREKAPLRHHRIYSSVSIQPPRHTVEEKKKNIREKCNEESLYDVLENRRKIFLDMSSHCVTNIWEWSLLRRKASSTNAQESRRRVSDFPKSSWHRKKFEYCQLRIGISRKQDWR